MSLPELNITFSQAANNTVSRNSRGTLFLILKEGASYEYTENPIVMTDIGDIPAASGISKKNFELIKLALKGNETAPKKVIAYFIGSKANETLDSALSYAEKVNFDWIAIAGADDTNEDAGETAKIKAWVLSQRETAKKPIFAVLANCEADSEFIVNFVTNDVVVGSNTFTASEFTARIAGIICGTDLSHSITYTTLPEVESCEALSKQDLDKADEEGKLVAFWDGEKVKLGRGVNSLTTNHGYGSDIKKIKIAQAKAVIESDLIKSCSDGYIGKYANTYSNRCILLTAISSYFDTLKVDGIVSDYDVSFDTDAIKAALKSDGIDYSDMTDEEIKTYDYKTFVFIKIKTKILDAIEDISINISI